MRLIRRNVPLEGKLTAFAMLTSGTALALACLSFLAYESVVFRSSMVDDLSTTAAMVADNSTASLAFSDPASAAKTLGTLAAHPHIVGAAIYDSQDEVFAIYRRPDVSAESFRAPAAEPDGHRFSDDTLTLFRRINLAGEKTGTVYIQSDLGEMRARLWRYALIVVAVMIAASLVAFMLSRKLRASISDPIFHLAGVANAVAAARDYSLRADKRNEDELGQLTDGFNRMLEEIQARDAELQAMHHTLEARVDERTRALRHEIQEREQAQAALEKVHKQLVEASRRAGMAEVATDVLHNVGNVLNSVNVSAAVAADRTRKSKAPDLARVAQLLRGHESRLAEFFGADAPGRHLPGYLQELSDHLLTERSALLAELDSLRVNLEHIKEIVRMQQDHARVSPVTESVSVTELMEDSLRMDAGALDREGVEIVRDFHDVPRITVDKHKLLQILVNLLRNAKHACAESERPDKRLTLRVAGGPRRISISVIDNGVGIAPENMTRIFGYGFTTRRDGHGFGLHGSALAARQLGGSLRAHSDGPGQGAQFTLELPVRPPDTARAPGINTSPDFGTLGDLLMQDSGSLPSAADAGVR